MKVKLILIVSISFLIMTSNVVAETAVFAGGCFWCMESDFEKLKDRGVLDVVSGFTGGITKNPTYNGDHTGHYEAIEVSYDPKRISYQQLLDHYWLQVDPFDDKGQFCDKGHSYLSAIFVANEQQRKLAQQSRQKVVARFPGKKVITPVLNAGTFYPIAGNESYHQDFYKNNPIRYKFYRYNCGRDARLREIWGEQAAP